MKIWATISQKGWYLFLPPLDVIISVPEFSRTGPFQHGKETFSCDEHLSLYMGVSVLLQDYFCSLVPQLTPVGGNHETMGKKTGCWTSGFPWELRDVFQNIPLVCENGKLPVVKTGVSMQFLLLQWRTLRFAFAASKEIMFSSLWDHINCSSSNGSFFTAKKMCRIRESVPRVW